MATVMLQSVNSPIKCRRSLIKKVQEFINDTVCFKNSFYEFGSA